MSNADSTIDPEPGVNRKYLAALGILVLILAGYLASSFFGGPPSPSALVSQCLSATDAGERKRAAEGLAAVVDRVVALPLLRRVAKETKDPEVLALVLCRMLVFRDNENLALCVDGLKNPSKDVRAKVYGALQAFYGGSLPDGIECSVDASAEEYAAAVTKLSEFYSKAPKMMAPAGMPVASRTGTDTPNATPLPTPTPTPSPTPTPGPSPTPAPAPATAAPASPPPPTAPTEYPAVTLLVWMCHALAILVLIVELGGALSLIFAERSTGKKAQALDQTAPSVVVPAVENNSPSMWTKIALLVAGAVCIVALLTTAEMVRMTVRSQQWEERMEQKIDYLSHTR